MAPQYVRWVETETVLLPWKMKEKTFNAHFKQSTVFPLISASGAY